MRNVALDPAVIALMPHLNTCEFLLYLRRRLKGDADWRLKLVRDDSDILWGECRRYEEEWKNELQGLASSTRYNFISRLLNHWLEWTGEKPSQIKDTSVFLDVARQECTVGQIESVLIGLATNKDVILVANGDDQGGESRCIICDQRKGDALGNRLPHFTMTTADQARGYLERELHSILLERRMADYIKTRYEFRYDKVVSPYEPPFLRDGAGEVDVYAEDDAGEVVRILVCECKLRMPGKNSNYVNLGEVEKLVGKVQAVRSYESDRWARKGRSVRTWGMIVSNSDGITKEASDLARKECIDKLQATLSTNWHHTTDWRIVSCTKMPVIELKTDQ